MLTPTSTPAPARHQIAYISALGALGWLLVSAPCLAETKAPGSPPGPDLSAKYAIDPQDPEKSVPTQEEAMKNPLEMGYLMMDLIARGEAATGRGDYKAAAGYYRAIAKAVPERATAFSKLCKSYEALGDTKKALASCKEALGKGGVEVDDYARYVRLSLKQEEPLEPAQIEEFDAIVVHIRQQLPDDPDVQLKASELACEIAVRLEDTQRLRTCTKELIKLAPKDARTLTYRWALALKERNFKAAEAIIAGTKGSTMPAAAVAEMRAKLEAARAEPPAWMKPFAGWGLWAVLALVIGTGLMLLARRKPGGALPA